MRTTITYDVAMAWALLGCSLLLGVLSVNLIAHPAGAQRPTTRITEVQWAADPTLAPPYATFLVEHGPPPTVRRGRIALLACASATCDRYTVTVAGACRTWSVGATLVESTPCLYLPGVRR